MSETVRWRDARAVFRLLGELNQEDAAPTAWRTHFVEGLLPLIGAQVGVAAEAVAGQLVDGRAHRGAIDAGWATQSDRQTWLSVCERTEVGVDPSDPAIAKLGHRSFTRPRSQLVETSRWRSSVMWNEHYRPAGLHEFLISAVWLPSRGVSHFLLLMKPTGDQFRDRETDLVAHAHRELAAQWEADALVRLPRQLRRTLRWLEAGLSEKEVADRMSLSVHTVRDTCKALHRRFGVHNRTALLAVTRKLPRAPALAVDELGSLSCW
jgi:Bacterial regulatory proteins, luxR family